MELANTQINAEKAKQLNDLLKGKGFPTPGRMLILSPTGEQRTKTGIIISQTVDKKDLPRKGVVIQNNSELQVEVGNIVTYGMYAGKEITLNDILSAVELNKEDYTFTILSDSEVVYIESNN